MKRSGKRRFQTLGMRMLQFSRRIISDYVPSGDLSEMDEADSEWSYSPDEPDSAQQSYELEPVGDGPTYVPPPTYAPPPPEAPRPAAPPRTVEPTARRQAPQPVQPTTPSAPKPPVQRKPVAESSGSKLDQRLLKILDAHQQLDAEREAIREQKKAMFSAPPTDVQRSPDQSSETHRPRRGRASFDYVETSSLKRGMEDDMPPTAPAPAPTPVEDTVGDSVVEAPTSEGTTPAEIIQRAEAIQPSDIDEAPPAADDYVDTPSAVQTPPETVVQRSPEPTSVDETDVVDLEAEFPEDDLEAFQRRENPTVDSSPEVVQRKPEPYPTTDTDITQLPYAESGEAESGVEDTQNWQSPTAAESPAPQTIQRSAEPSGFEEAIDEAESPAPRTESIQRAEQAPTSPSPAMQDSDADDNEPKEWATEVYSPELVQRAIDYNANTIEYPEDQEWVTEYDPYGDYDQLEDDTYAENASYDHDFSAQDVADSPAPHTEHIQREIYDDYPTDVVSHESAPGEAASVDFGDMPTIQRAPEDDMPEYAGDPEFFTNFGAPQEPEVDDEAYAVETVNDQPALEYLDGDDPFFDQPTEKVSPSWATPAAEQVQRDYQAPENVEYDDYGEQPSDGMFQQTDLYSAMLDEGMIAPSPVDVPAAPPHIQRYPETTSGNADSSYTPTDSSEIHSSTDRPRSLEEDLMGLLDMRPPVADRSPEVIQRDTAVTYGQSDDSTFGTNVNYAPSDQIQRADTPASSASASAVSSEEAPPSEEGGDVDVEKLARDVFSALRNRLRIERERRHKN